MSKQEIIQFDYDNMRKSRNEGRLSGKYSDMTNHHHEDHMDIVVFIRSLETREALFLRRSLEG